MIDVIKVLLVAAAPAAGLTIGYILAHAMIVKLLTETEKRWGK